MARDQEKVRAARRRWYHNNRERESQKQVARTKARKDSINAYLTTYKANSGCCRCGESDPVCLDFHHVEPLDKEVNLANAARDGLSMKRVEAEIDKCVVLCSNCHRKFHAGRFTLD